MNKAETFIQEAKNKLAEHVLAAHIVHNDKEFEHLTVREKTDHLKAYFTARALENLRSVCRRLGYEVEYFDDVSGTTVREGTDSKPSDNSN